MSAKKLLSAFFFTVSFLVLQATANAQDKTVTGKVTDSKDGTPVVGASVQAKGTRTGTTTRTDGTFSLTFPSGVTTLIISSIGYETKEVSVAGINTIDVSFVPTSGANLNEVVVTGYGTARRRDLTGAVASVKEKDFNKGVYTSPDQLIQGKVSGVQMINNSGAPGGGSTVKIRGNATVTGSGQPLYVVDGVPLDGRSPRPSVGDLGFGGGNPSSNPLNFLNPSDIASIDILKDASATAIYGSRAAYGVVLITTKKGRAGETRVDFNTSIGFSSIMKRIEVLNASQFRQALAYYGVNANNDKGADVDALDAILQTGLVQNYNVGISGGSEFGRFRLSLGALNQEGIVQKTGIKKFSANFNANLKFLQSKRLGLDINIIPSQYTENIAPISNDAGAGGSLIGMALQWNPTQALKVGDSIVNIGGNSIFNPLGISKAIDDEAKVTTILASIAPSYKLTNWLEYKFLFSINYATGTRRTSRNQNINLNNTGAGAPYTGVGFAAIGTNELITSQFTHTLSADKKISPNLNLNAVIGYEYMKFINKGSRMSGNGPAGGFGQYGLDYTDYIQYSEASSRVISSYNDPTTELQSYFARAVLNYKDKILVTGTFRADGSTKFGKNNKYGYFPSFAAAWNITREDFFKVDFINSLKIRAGWGKTGNQEFPAGSAQARYSFGSNGSLGQVNNPNPDLKWQSDRQFNIGFDAVVLKEKISVTVDYFNKLTTDLLYPTFPIQPAPPGSVVTWKNLPGEISNTGVEAAVNASIVSNKDFGWDLGVNATFIKNNVSGLPAPISTGALHGQGITGSTVEVIQNGLPINAFFARHFEGLDKSTGIGVYTDEGNTRFYAGSPNPKTLLGISTTVRYKALNLIINMNGAFGQKIYNNTLNNVINVGDIKGGRNIALSVYQSPVKESFGNAVRSSDRFIEDGSYLKMANMTLSYGFGNIGKIFRGVNLFVTGQNLFVITKFSGFDPEVNVDKSVNSVPSVGIEYIPYPSARTITFGLNFSL
jgi:TonB-linked SusC/RagA family outer membrane protein